MGVIYALCDPATAEIRYVGQAKDLARRIKRHTANARSGSTLHVYNWWRSLDEAPGVIVLEETEDLNTAERQWIAGLRSIGYRLTNLTDGGDGGDTSAYWTDAGKQRQLDAITGRIPSSEQRRKVSEAHTGMKRSEETRARQRAAAQRRERAGRGRWGRTRGSDSSSVQTSH